MSLQLLVENAVKHGVCKNKLGGEVIVFARKSEGNVVFGVRNSGSLEDSDNFKRKCIGLENLKRRLELNYGIRDGFKISEFEKIVILQVCILVRVK